MKRISLAILTAAFCLVASTAKAQLVANGTLTVTANVQGSIQLVFNGDPVGVPLAAGAGTNAATLALGNVSAFGVIGGNITRIVNVNNFTVSTPVDVNVTVFNVNSLHYTLTAQLAVADLVNVWAVNAVVVNNAAPAQITAAGNYGVNAAEAVAITIPLNVAPAPINNTINFAATAN